MDYPPAKFSVSTVSLPDIFGSTGAAVGPTGPVVNLAGFDVIAQFSRLLLQREVVQSLGRSNLSSLSAFVPWGVITLPPSLLAAIPVQLRLSGMLTPARLELRFVNPYLAALRWPQIVSGGIGGTTQENAKLIGEERYVDIGWQVEINVLTPNLTTTGPAKVRMPAAGAGGSLAFPGGLLENPASPAQGSGGDSSWNRYTLVSGTAITSATAQLSVSNALWRFGMGLDFSDTVPSINSPAAPLADFLATEAGQSLLNQLMTPLAAAGGIELGPQIAPAGALAMKSVQRRKLPPFHVQDLLLTDARGNPVLCFCAQLGSATGGVTRLVQSYLQGGDFAYLVSTNVLGPALKTRWSSAASGLSVVSTIPVEPPVAPGASPTAPAHAQIRVTFSDTLDDVSILAATEDHGDPLRLLSTQTIQLLHLWDWEGIEQTNLGPLGQPQTMPLALPLCLFDANGPSPDALQPNMKDFLMKLMAILFFPMLDSFSASSASVTGFASSATQTLFIRWALSTALSGVAGPISGTATHIQ